jgi:hydrogenase expression/formation protein HypE
VAFVPGAEAERALGVLRGHARDTEPALVGTVDAEEEGMVTLVNEIGTERVLDMLSGEQLPRIC